MENPSFGTPLFGLFGQVLILLARDDVSIFLFKHCK